ncbi:uncharacterized protein [Pyxicephalus adspersus]|uniref:uncharacterized protein isoform X2 n=1 Tax=Pyxicephalus adspersus TaxID=30357 RepID=UPI003B5B07C9
MLLAMVNDNESTCTGSEADRVYYCKTFQKDYSEGTKTLIFEERDVGLINSTVFSSPNLKSVVTLTLTGSKIHTIESGAFEHFSSLITLELQNNRLTTVLPSWFHDPTVLEQLNLAGNSIRQLHPGMLEGYSNLKVLNLSRNEISRIETESFATLSKLSSVDLSYNKIFSLERKMFASLNATLRLHGNPWNCSCGQKDFMLFLQELVNASRLNDSILVTCHYPPDLNDMIVWNVSEVNCSASVLTTSSALVFHQIVLPALFVVLGGLFFSLSMWMIICFLRSQCKNRVTNMSDSKSNLHQSMEKEEDLVISQDNHNQVLEDRLRDTAGNSIVGLLHELNLNREDKNPRSFSEQSLQPFQCRNHKIENKFNGFVNSELRADKSKVEGISKCLKSPILLPCPNTISRGSHLKTEDPIWLMTTDDHPDVKVPSIENSDTKELNCESTCPTTTKVHSGTTILSKDPAHLEAQALNYDMTGVWSINTETLLPTNKCYSPEVKLNTNAEVEQKPSRKSPEYLNQETDQVRYFETHIELMETMINEAHILNGAIKDHISSQENDSQPTKLEIAKTLGKKSKTWSSIYDLENHSVNFHLTAELDPKRPIDVSKGSTIKTEGSDESYFSKELQEELSTITGEVNNTQKKYMSSGDRSQWKYSNHFSDHLDIADEQPGSSIVREKQKVNKKLHQSLHHPQMLGERLWKYHRNCCDEYQPCQTACKVLKQIKALEKTELVQKTKQSPPSDEELFKGNGKIAINLFVRLSQRKSCSKAQMPPWK